jgi:DNA-binding NtrC family response regulator
MTYVVVVDQHGAGRKSIEACLSSLGCTCRWVLPVDLPRTLEQRHPDLALVVADDAPACVEIACLERIHASCPDVRSVFLAAHSTEELAISAFHAGAHRYLKAPWTEADIRSAMCRLVPEAGTQPEDELVGGSHLIGRSPAIRELRQYLGRIAPVNSNVLILGETGTGKELVAELIHRNSRRAGRLVCLNTAAIPDALLENELFGHERGAFTGAQTAQSGKLAAADGGTLFFDEIGDVGLPIQAKLLRVIESRSVFRLGGSRPEAVDVRFLAATNDDLERATAEGRFRKDLFYRLNVIRVHLPPLRERGEDIPLLIAHYLKQFNRELGRRVRALSPGAMEVLCAHQWPGNIRELRNVLEALLVNLAPEATGVVDVPAQVMRQLALAVQAPISERDRLLRALAETNWNKSRAASRLQCSRMTLYRRMQRYKVHAGDRR